MKASTLFLTAVICILSFTSCSKKTVLPYFTDISEISEGTLPAQEYLPTIMPDDELTIIINSSNPRATSLYNQPLINPSTRADMVNSGTVRSMSYVVDTEGNIQMPILGKVHVAGLNVEQIRELITKMISKDVSDPNVTVILQNFTVVVAGEVNTPQTLRVTRNRFTILEALSASGDLTEYGERNNVLLIREENGTRKYVHLNLNNSDILTSPYYYLQPNDYIYVAPNKVRQDNSKYNQNNGFKLSIISTIVSAASVIASLVIALTVKN